MAGRSIASDVRESPARGRQKSRRRGEDTPKAPRAFADPLRLPAKAAFPGSQTPALQRRFCPFAGQPLAEVYFVRLSCDAFQGESEGAERYGKFFAASGRFDSACLRN